MTTNPKRSGIPLKWNLEAVNGFYEALLEHGKDFEKISIFLLKKSINRNPQKIPNHFTWVGVRCFYYRILKKASNLLHAYECRHPKVPVMAGVELKKSVVNNLILSSSGVSPKRQLSEQNELSKNDAILTAVSSENKPEDPDSTYSPLDFSLQENSNEDNDKREEDDTNDIFMDFHDTTSGNISILLPESEDSNLTDTENIALCEPNIQLYEENCQKISENEDLLFDLEAKNVDEKNLQNGSEIESPIKRDLTKESVKLDGLGRCSLDLVAVICYTKLYITLGERINSRNKDVLQRIAIYLGELVYKGTTRYRHKGHTKRFKIPICKGLKSPISMCETQKLKLQTDPVCLDLPTSANNSEASSDERPTSTTNIAFFHKSKPSKFRGITYNSFQGASLTDFSTETEQNICIELTPKDEITFKAVQSIARNPNLRIFASTNTLFADIIELLTTKWKKIFARTSDITLKFHFFSSDLPLEHSLDEISSRNPTIKNLLISQIPLSHNFDLQKLRLKYHFQTHYEHVLSDGLGSQLTPLSALVELLYTINQSETTPLQNKFPLGKNFPRKVMIENNQRMPKNVMTRNLLKNQLQLLRQIHSPKITSNNNDSTNTGAKRDRNRPRPNPCALKNLIEFLRSQKVNRKKEIRANKLLSAKTSKKGETRSIPSSFHSVLKEKANSRSLFSSDIAENSTPPNPPYVQPENILDNIHGDSVLENFDQFLPDYPYMNGNFDLTGEYPIGPNEFGGLDTFSMLADAYLGLDTDDIELPPTMGENFDANCPSVVSENFQSLLSELDGMVHEWESEEEVLANPNLTPIDTNSNPAKMFLQYFLNNSHEPNSEDHVMRSIFEDDSLDSLNAQHFAFTHSDIRSSNYSNHDNNGVKQT